MINTPRLLAVAAAKHQGLDELVEHNPVGDAPAVAAQRMVGVVGGAVGQQCRELYNLTTTGPSVAVALVVGTIELLQVLSERLGRRGAFFEFLNERLDFGLIGYIIVSLFLGAWLCSVVLWRVGRVEERYGDRVAQPRDAVSRP